MAVWYNITLNKEDAEDENFPNTQNFEEDPVQFYVVVGLVYLVVIFEFGLLVYFFCCPFMVYRRVVQVPQVQQPIEEEYYVPSKEYEQCEDEQQEEPESPQRLRRYHEFCSKNSLDTIPESSESGCNSDED